MTPRTFSTKTPKKKFYDLQRSLRAGKIAPVYFFTDEEQFMKDRAFALLKKKLIKPDYEDFNFVTFHGEETRAATILEALDTPPVLAEYRLIIVRNFHLMHQAERKKIINYVSAPHESTVLILETNKVKLNSGGYARLMKFAETYYFYHPFNEQDAAQFVVNELKLKKISITAKALRLMVESVGLNYQALYSELEKLLLLGKDTTTIDLDLVRRSTGIRKKFTIFDLQHSVVKRNLKASLNILENLLNNDVYPVLIVIMLARYYKTLMKITTMRGQRKMKSSEIKKELGLFYQGDETLRMATLLSLKDYVRAIGILFKADLQLKSLSVDSAMILELMVYKLCRNID